LKNKHIKEEMSTMKTNEKKKNGFMGWVFLAVAIVLISVFLAIPKGAPIEATATHGLPAEISTTILKKVWQQGSFILDVREQDEWNAGHISGATLIPLGELANRASELPKDVPIYVVCRSGNRSAVGRDTLLNAGFTTVTSMAGGMNDWVAQGFEVVTGP
jgi:phage shock protein E